MPVEIAEPRGLLTSFEVAERTGRTVDTVRRWCRECGLKGQLVGKVLYIDPRDLDDFLAKR